MLTNVDGSNERRLGATDVDGNPAWAPDGRSLLVATGNRLYRIDAVTGEMTPIRIQRSPEARIYGGKWSPDGTRILVRRFVSGDNVDLFTMLADGTDVVRITNTPEDERFIDWGVHPLN